MTTKKTLCMTVRPPPIQYELIFGNNLFQQALDFVRLHGFKPILITTTAIQDFFPHIEEDKIVLPPGEGIKSRSMKEKIEDALIERGCGRDSCLIAIGGGALLDLIGFVAATYCRGIAYISMPSTLTAMTDASIGGKTGVNVDEAKNWIGAFHHPRKIFIDLTLLRTLPQKEFANGLSETIKHSLIADRQFFDFLEKNYEALLMRDPELLEEMVYKSCQIKKSIVEKDPYETKGLRRILNFGHTIGHALETLSNYSLPHGQAVMMGMKVEAAIARRMDYLSSAAYEQIESFLNKFPVAMDFPTQLPYEMLIRDKKGRRVVVLTGIGSAAPFEGEYVTHLTKEALKAGWNDVVRNH